MSTNRIRVIVLVLVLVIAGIGMTVNSISDIIKINGGIPDFNFDSMQNIKKGDFVGGYVANIIDCYANETTTESTLGIETSSRTSAEYFLMPLINDADWENELYITIRADKYDDRRTLYEICDQTWEYYDGNEDVQFTEFPIICWVKEIDSDLEPLLLDYFRETEFFEAGDNARNHYLPYELVIYDTSNATTNLVIGLILLAAGVVIGLIFWKQIRPKQEPETAYNAAGSSAYTGGGFAENAPEPFPDIPQPPSADEFFERTPRTPKAPVQTEQPAPQTEITQKCSKCGFENNSSSKFCMVCGNSLADEPAPAPEPVPQVAPADPYGDMDTLDTSSLSFDGLDDEDYSNP